MVDSKPRKVRKDKGVKRKGKGKKIARGAKKLFETDLISAPRRRALAGLAAPAQQRQPVFNLNLSQNLKNIVGAFANASATANYAKTQEINRQAADASYRAETIVGLNRENFLASLEKQRLEKKVERGERAYAGAVAQSQRRIQEIGDTMFNMFSGGGAAAPPRARARKAARVFEIVSMGEESDAPLQGFSDVPPSRQLSAEDIGIISRPISRVASAEMASPMGVFTPRRSLAEIRADERALRGEDSDPIGTPKIGRGALLERSPFDPFPDPDTPILGRVMAAQQREFGGGGSAYASEQYLQNQPRGRPVIADPATARTERINRKIAKLPEAQAPPTKSRAAKPREELLLAREDADAAIAAARAKRRQEISQSMTLEQIETNSVFGDVKPASGGVAGGGGVRSLIDVHEGAISAAGGGGAAAKPKLKLRLKPETIARLAAEDAAKATAAAAAAARTGETTDTASSRSKSPKRAATTPQRLRAAEIRSQLSAAANLSPKSIKFATGKGSRKAVSGVDWVAEIADLKRKGLTGAAAIEAIKQKHRDVLQ